MLSHSNRTAFALCSPVSTPPRSFLSHSRTAFITRMTPVPKRLSRSNCYASIATNGVPKATSAGVVPSLTPNTKPPPPPNHIVRFLRLLSSNWTVYPALLAALVGSVCSVSQPLLLGKLVGIVSRIEFAPVPNAQSQVLKRILSVGAVFLAEIVATVIYILLITRAIDTATRRLREMVFEKALRNDVGFFDQTGRAHIERTLSSEITQVRDGIWRNLSRDRGMRAFTDVVLGLILNVVATGRFGTPIFAILVPITSTIVARLGLRNGRLASEMSIIDSGIQNFLNEKLRGLRTLKAFGAELREHKALTKLLDGARACARRLTLSQATNEAANRTSIYLTILTFFTVGGLLICAGKLTYESFASVTGFIWVLNFAMQGVTYTITDASRVSRSLKTIYELSNRAEAYNLALTKSVPHSDSNQPARSFSGHVRFENVDFYYPSRPDVAVLRNISFSAPPGQMIALVGFTGGGKSTIAALLAKFYTPSSGIVRLDGIDIHSIPNQVYANQISLVDQDPVLFQGSIRENIAYGVPDEDVSDDRIIKAAKEANAHEFIVKLKDGYDAIWSPSSNLSGGQRQRIAIARSLIKSPKVLILDEATSALDIESERMVQSALEKVMKNRTVVIIAHRLSTVRSADCILFVKEGHIVERGSYDELYRRPNSYFRALVQSATESQEESTHSF